MPHLIEAYQCDFCGRCFSRRNWAQRHENACNNNPARRHCKTCIHSALSAEIPVCRIHNIPVYDKPYEIDCKREVSRLNGYDERAVPGTCIHYEYKGSAEWTREERST